MSELKKRVSSGNMGLRRTPRPEDGIGGGGERVASSPMDELLLKIRAGTAFSSLKKTKNGPGALKNVASGVGGGGGSNGGSNNGSPSSKANVVS